MPATVEGTFRIIDRASGPMRRMATQAKTTDRAFTDLGKKLDRMGIKKAAGEIDGLTKKLRELDTELKRKKGDTDRLAGSMGGLSKVMASTSRDSKRLEDKTKDLGRAQNESASRANRTESTFSKLGSTLARVGSTIGMTVLRMAAMGSALVGAGQGVTYLGGAVAALLPKLASLGSLMAAMPAAIGAAVTGFGAMAAGLSGVMGAVTAGLAQQANASKSAVDMADQQRNALRAVRDAQMGVTRAEEGVRDAQRNSRSAQRALTEARREARRELVDMQLAAKGSLLGEKAAAISLARARRNLANANFTGPDADLEQREARLGVQQAQLGVRQAGVDRRRAQQDARRAQRRGVGGNEGVRSAREGVVQASRGIRDAMASQTQATEALADAQRAQNRMMKEGTADAQAYALAMKNLSPEARRFVTGLVEMRKEFIAFRNESGRDLLPHLTDSLQHVSTLLPVVAGAFRRAGGLIGTQIEGFARDMATVRKQDFASIMDNNAQNAGKMAGALRRIVNGLMDLMVAARPFTDWVADTIVNWAKWFEKTMAVGRATGRLAGYFKRARDDLEQFGRIAANIWNVLTGIGRAARPLGDWLFDAFERGSEAADRWVNSLGGQTRLRAFFDGLKAPLAALAGLFGDLAVAWGRVVSDPGGRDAFVEAINTLRTAVPGLERIALSLTGLAPVLAQVVVQLVALIDNLPINPLELVLRVFEKILRVVNFLIEKVPGLGTAIGLALAGSIMLKAVGMVQKLAGLWGGLFSMFRRNRGVAAPMMGGPAAGAGVPAGGAVGGGVRGAGRRANVAGRVGYALARGGGAGRVPAAIAGGRTAASAARGPGAAPGRFGGPAALAGSLAATGAGAAIGGDAGSALSYAGMGAGLGMMAGPWGAAAGALGGGALGLFMAGQAKRKAAEQQGAAAGQQVIMGGGTPQAAQARLASAQARLAQTRDVTTTQTRSGHAATREVDAVSGNARKKLQAEVEAIEAGLPQLRKAYDQWKEARQVERAADVGAKQQQIFEVFRKGGQTALQATRSTVKQITGEISGMRGQARRTLSQQALDWINSQKRAGRITGREARQAKRRILTELRQTQRTAQSINGEILSGTRTKWDAIGKALKDPVEQARQKMQTEFTKMQKMAVGVLQEMGFTKGQARGIIAGKEKGGAAGRVAASDAAQGPSPTQLAATDRNNARGGRIPGQGLRDNVKVAPGQMAAPGELIVNRHTEGRVDRALNAFGTSLGREVNNEQTPHHVSRGSRGRGHTVPPSMRHAARGARIVGVPGFPGERAAASVLDEIAAFTTPFGLRLSDAYGAGHQSPGHTVYGTAADIAGPDRGMNRAAAAMVRKGYKVLYHAATVPGTMDWPGHGPSSVAGGNAHIHVEFGQKSGAVGNVPGGGGQPGVPGGGAVPRLRIRTTGVGGAPGAVGDAALRGMGGGLQRRMNQAGGGGGPGGGAGPATPTRGVMTFNQVARIAEGAGLPGVTFAQIARGESALNPRAVGHDPGGTQGLGLWQITTGFNDDLIAKHGGRQAMFNARRNAAAAKEIYERQGIGAWYGTKFVTGNNLHYENATGGRIPWFAGGGDFMVRKPTTIGVGERGPERVSVTPSGRGGGGRGGGGGVNVNVGTIINHEEGDIRKVLHRELSGLVDDLQLVGGGLTVADWEDQFSGQAMRVRIKAIPGVTDKSLAKGVLKTPFLFQCSPLESFKTEYSYSHSDYDTINAGQVSRRGGRQLRTVSFDTMLVWEGSYTLTGLQGKANQSVGSAMAHQAYRLRTICESGEPVRLTCALPMDEEAPTADDAITVIDWSVTLRSYSIEERAGEPDARYLGLQFTEFRHPTMARDGFGRRKTKTDFPKTHKLTSRDTLVSLAQRYYGDPDGWHLIAEVNGIRRSGQNHAIVKLASFKVGSKVTIPPFKKKGHYTAAYMGGGLGAAR